MNLKEKESKVLKQALDVEWYAQGCNATPLFIMAAALSGFLMGKNVPLSYTKFLFEFNKDFGKICYAVSDLKKINIELVKIIASDEHYFEKLRKAYDKEQVDSQIVFKKIDSLILTTLSSNELAFYLEKSIKAIDRSVGIGHVIEPFTLIEEERTKNNLKTIIKDEKELNLAFIILTTPKEKSFIQESQELLMQIKEAKGSLKDTLIDKYLKKYFWIKNTYVGRYTMTRREVLDEAESAKITDFGTLADLKEKKKKIIKKYGIPPDLLISFNHIEFITNWQDERKSHILRAIDYLDRLIEEKARREEFDPFLLKFYTVKELLGEITLSKKELEERSCGVCFYSLSDSDHAFTREDYKKLKYKLEYVESKEIKLLNGVAASLGTAIGKIKVCDTIASLSKVEEGDILVASMTRPEYLPAMKKASAFVTDEGGITCHAAIVAREMGKPCIIGTRIATKVLKDGDLVEVKGNHGLVIIRERASI